MSSSSIRAGILVGLCPLLLSLWGGCVGEVDGGPARPSGTPTELPPDPTGSGIRLTPPEGVGERALRCEADHAPLRRLSHREYERTMADLFAGQTLPALMVAPDERRGGFTNNYEGQAPSVLRITQYYENAERIASAVTPGLVSSLGCSDAACFRSFVAQLGARAYRRPLSDAEVESYAAFFTGGATAGDFALSAEFAIMTMLQAPETLYRPEFGGADGTLTQHEIASRLSYFVWGTMPDDALFAAAAAGELSGEGLRTQVDRLLASDRARDGIVSATMEWLDVERLERILKAEEYEFTPEVRTHLRSSLELFLWERVIREGGSLDDFFTARGAYVDSTIGPIFGVDDAGPELVWRDLPGRAGAVTHPAILAIHGHGDYGSPVLRGVFVLTELLCDPPRPPPPGTPMSAPPRVDGSGTPLTNREGYALLTQSSAGCAACHDQINPIGFAFETFDTAGASRADDSGLPIDDSGSSRGFTLGTTLTFDGALDLAEQLNTSERARACVVDRWVRYAAGGGALAYDPCLREDLEAVVAREDASLGDLVVAIAIDPRFAAAEVVE